MLGLLYVRPDVRLTGHARAGYDAPHSDDFLFAPETAHTVTPPEHGSKRRLPTTRIVSALVAFAVSILVIGVGLPLMAPMYVLLTLVALQEYAVMMNLRGIPIRRRSLWVATLLTLPASLPVTYPGMEPLFDGVSWREALLGIFALYLDYLRGHPAQRKLALQHDFYALSATFTSPGSWVTRLPSVTPPTGWWGSGTLAFPVLATAASDVGAYIVGSLFGRRKLAPQLSPNKTLEGAFGGLGLAVTVVTATAWGLERILSLRVDLYDAILFSILSRQRGATRRLVRVAYQALGGGQGRRLFPARSWRRFGTASTPTFSPCPRPTILWTLVILR